MPAELSDSLRAAASIGPALALLWFFLRREAYEQPPALLWTAFALGTLTLLPLWPLTEALRAVPIERASIAGLLWRAFVLAGASEELVKLAALLIVLRRAGQPSAMDAMVYGAAVALGFASVENLHYVFHHPEHWRSVALVRGALAVPFHASVGALVGLALARAAGRPSAMLAAWIAASLVHGLYDTLLMLRDRSVGETAATALSLASMAIVLAVGWAAAQALKPAHAPVPRGWRWNAAWAALAAGFVAATFAFLGLAERLAATFGLHGRSLAEGVEALGAPTLALMLALGLAVYELAGLWLDAQHRRARPAVSGASRNKLH